jgi:hypothetical protein
MAPDGGEACAAYAELHAKHLELIEVVQRVARAFADTPLGEVGLASKRHEKCRYETCQWPNCICEHALLHDREEAYIADIRRELANAREALNRLEEYLKEHL